MIYFILQTSNIEFILLRHHWEIKPIIPQSKFQGYHSLIQARQCNDSWNQTHGPWLMFTIDSWHCSTWFDLMQHDNGKNGLKEQKKVEKHLTFKMK